MKISRDEIQDPIRSIREALDFLADGDETASSTDAEQEPASTRFFGSALDALKSVAPEGSTVNAVGFDSLDSFLRAGYRVTDGDADVAIARGGEREFALARKLACRKLVLVPTHAYASSATERYRTADGAYAVMKHGKKPNAVSFDRNDTDRNLASVFGEIAALDLDAFDLTFGAQMRGERTDNALTEEVAELVTDTTNKLRGVVKDRAACAEILIESGKTAARITERNPALLHASGAAQTAEALRMLYSAEERELGMRGETEFLLAGIVTDFYIKKLNESDAAFPPDNNKRIDRLCEYFATDVRRTCVYIRGIPAVQNAPVRIQTNRIPRRAVRNARRRKAQTARRRDGVQTPVSRRRLRAQNSYRQNRSSRMHSACTRRVRIRHASDIFQANGQARKILGIARHAVMYAPHIRTTDMRCVFLHDRNALGADAFCEKPRRIKRRSAARSAVTERQHFGVGRTFFYKAPVGDAHVRDGNGFQQLVQKFGFPTGVSRSVEVDDYGRFGASRRFFEKRNAPHFDGRQPAEPRIFRNAETFEHGYRRLFAAQRAAVIQIFRNRKRRERNVAYRKTIPSVLARAEQNFDVVENHIVARFGEVCALLPRGTYTVSNHAVDYRRHGRNLYGDRVNNIRFFPHAYILEKRRHKK